MKRSCLNKINDLTLLQLYALLGPLGDRSALTAILNGSFQHSPDVSPVIAVEALN